MVIAFGREFHNLDGDTESELRSLEFDGTITTQHYVDELHDFALVRFRLTPMEIVRYIDGMQAYDEWLSAATLGMSDQEALSRVSNAQVRNEAATYHGRPELGLCPAAFMGDDLENLLCFETGPRREVLGSGYERDRRRLVDEVISNLPAAVDHLKRPGGQGLCAIPFTREEQIRDLLFVMLCGVFPDVTIEDPNSEFAGSGKRVDLSIEGVSTLIEVKFARRDNAARIVPELLADIGSYHLHRSCETLRCVIWDPDRALRDRAAIERDLSGLRTVNGRQFVVRAHVVP